MRKTIILVLVLLFASTTLAFAAWKVIDLAGGKEDSSSGQAVAADKTETVTEEAAGQTPGEQASQGAESEATTSSDGSVDAASQPIPDQRYVGETQRHQNFFIALANGDVKRLDAVATDYQPAGDAYTSYLYFALTTNSGTKSDGTMVLKQEGGLWRIAAVRQLEGSLGGGTDYPTPESFEADLERELSECQALLTKMAEGRLDYLVVDSVAKNSDTETVLTGRAVGVGGRIQSAQMTLRKDYNVWHMVNVALL